MRWWPLAVAAGIGGAISKSAVDVKQGAEGLEVSAIDAGKSGETIGKDLIGNLAGVATGGLVSKQVGNFVGDKMAYGIKHTTIIYTRALH